MEKAEGRRDVEDIRAAMATSPEFAELADASSRRHKLYQLMAEHPDPLWREIGQQLRDGLMRPSDVLATPQYREQLQAGMADGVPRLGQMVGALDDHLRAEAAETSDAKTTGDGAGADSDDDLAETLGPILRRR